MQAGDTIARRYVLLRADDADLPGLTRYLAKDSRLNEDVTVDIVTSRAPSAVIRAAQKARVLRDKRLSRVLAAGIERRGNDRVFYVATERPHGVRLDELLGRIAFTPASAAAVIGEAAAALAAVVGTGVHHGLVRPAAITVTDKGRVMLSGLGVDGVIAAQSGQTRVTNERADAVALARIYVTAITALDPSEVTTSDIPGDVPQEARALCRALIKGAGPTSLADVTAALGTGNSRVLKALVAEAPSLWWPRSPAVVIPAPLDAVDEAPGPEYVNDGIGLVEAGPDDADIAGEDFADRDFAHEDSADRDFAHEDSADRDFAHEDFEHSDNADIVAAELVDGELVDGEIVTTAAPGSDVIDGEVIDLVALRPRTRFGGAVDDLDEFHDIVAAQNEGTQQSVAEAILDRLHQRFPASAPLANAAGVAHRRAQAAAPLNAGPLLLALLIVTVFVSAVVGAALLTKPYVPDFDGHNNPLQTYPEYTVGMTPTP